MMANVAEIIIFILLGVTCIQEFSIDFSKHWNTGFFFFTLFFIILYRCVATFGLTYIINKLRKEPIPLNDQVLMALSGLRGNFSFKRTIKTKNKAIYWSDEFLRWYCLFTYETFNIWWSSRAYSPHVDYMCSDNHVHVVHSRTEVVSGF